MAEGKPHLDLEIGHVLFIDIIGYSKLLIDDQRELQQQLNQIVRGTGQFRAAESAGKLVRLPTGDGIALVFFASTEAPVECALEISEALQSHPQLRLRMGINTGPVSGVADVNDRSNIAGAGINMAQRVMDIGDAGHILLSKRAAEDLAQYRQWEPHLHDLGEWEVKHGVRISFVNLYSGKLGNPQLPEKLKQQRRRQIAQRRRRRMLIASLVLLTLGLAAGALVYVRQSSAKLSNSPVTPPEKSIAVLPFENRSEDKANVYFADGIQDEILTRLAKIGDLKVISRTSTEKYRSRPDNLKTVAEELGVAAVLEGSVQKVGSKVRIVVQLIAAKSDHHLWAETYDRSVDDIFAVQSEIATTVASALQANLTPQESLALKSVPTRNQKAYDLFLRAEHSYRIGRMNMASANVHSAVELYRQAVAEDTHFALAYARLSLAESYLRFLGAGPGEAPPDYGRINAEKALALQPDLMEAHLALAYIDLRGRRDYPGALEHLARAEALAPKNAEVFTALGYVYSQQLRDDDAIAVGERAAQYDPGNSRLFFDLGVSYLSARRNDKVQPAFERALTLDPTNGTAAGMLAEFLIAEHGDVEGARRLLRGLGPSSQDGLAYTYFLTREFDQAIRLIEELPADFSTSWGLTSELSKAQILGLFLSWAGHGERAQQLLKPGRDRLIALLADETLAAPMVARHWATLAYFELALGNRDAGVLAVERGAQSVVHVPLDQKFYRLFLAEIYARAGRSDEAIPLISEFLKTNSGWTLISPYRLRLDPLWDPLRDDPRFQALLKEYPTE